MKKFKQFLAYLLAFVTVLSSIEPFSLVAYADEPEEPSEWVTFTFENASPEMDDQGNFTSRFWLANDNYQFVMDRTDNMKYFIGDAECDDINVPIAVEPVWPDGLPDVSGDQAEWMQDLSEEQQAAYNDYQTALEAYNDLIATGPYFTNDDGFVLHIKRAEAETAYLVPDANYNDLPKPILALIGYKAVDSEEDYTYHYFYYSGSFDSLNATMVPLAISNFIEGDDNLVKVGIPEDQNFVQFNAGQDNPVRWNDNGQLVVSALGTTFTFQFGTIDEDGMFTEAQILNCASPDFNAYYTTHYVPEDPEAYEANPNNYHDWVLDTENPIGDPQILVDTNATYGIRLVDAGVPGIDISNIDIQFGNKHLDNGGDNNALHRFTPEGGYEYDAYVIDPSYFQDNGYDQNGNTKYDLGFNINLKKINNVTIKTVGGGTVSDIAINDKIVDDANDESGVLLKDEYVGNTRGWWENLENGQNRCFAEFDDIWFRGVSEGYVVTKVTVDNPGTDDDFEVSVNGYNDRDKRYDVNNKPVMKHSNGDEFWDPNDFSESAGDTISGEFGVIKDNATVTFHTKQVFIEINSDGDINQESQDKQIHTYASNITEALALTKEYYKSLDETDRQKLRAIDWNVRVKDISLDDSTFKFVEDTTDPDDPADKEIFRFVKINLYNNDGEYGTLTVPANKTFTFPGQIQGQYAEPDENGNVSAGNKIVLGSGAKLNVYTAYDESYLAEDGHLEQQGCVHVYEISGTNATITVGSSDEREDQNGAHFDTVKVTGVTKVTVNPRSNFNSIVDDYDEDIWGKNEETGENEIVGKNHIHRDPAANITVGTLELKGAEWQEENPEYDPDNEESGPEIFYNGRGGDAHFDGNDTVKFTTITEDRCANFNSDGASFAGAVTTLTANGRVEINNSNAFTISTITVGEDAEVNLNNCDTITAPKVTVAENGRFHVNESKAAVGTLTAGMNSNIRLSGVFEEEMTFWPMSSGYDSDAEPHNWGWYEKVGTEYVLSSDEHPVTGKKYYYSLTEQKPLTKVTTLTLAGGDEYHGGAHADFDGTVQIESLTVNEGANINSYGTTQVGTLISSSSGSSSMKTSGTFTLKNRANIRNYGSFNVYAAATVYGDSEIRTAGSFTFSGKVTLANDPDSSASDVRLIRQSGNLMSNFYIGGPVTGAFAKENVDGGVRFALYNADDIDYVWPGETSWQNVPDGWEDWDDETRAAFDPEDYEGPWHGTEVHKYDDNGTLQSWPLNETAFNAPAGNGENHALYALKKNQDEEQDYHFNAITYTMSGKEVVSCYELVPDSVTFYVADPDDEGNYPRWSESEVGENKAIVPFDHAFIDTEEILDFINDSANESALADKKIFIKIKGEQHFDALTLPANEVEFVGAPDSYNRVDVNVWSEGGDAVAIDHKLETNNVDFTFGGNPASLTLGDVALTDASLEIWFDETVESETVTLGNVTLTTTSDDINSSVESFRGTLTVGNVTVTENSSAWINGDDVEFTNLTVEDGAAFNLDVHNFSTETVTLGAVNSACFNAKTITVPTVTVADNANDVHFNAWDDGNGLLTIIGEDGITIGKNIHNISFESDSIKFSMIDIGEDSHPFIGARTVTVADLILREESSVGTWDDFNECSSVGNFEIQRLWMYNHSNLDADSILVKTATFVGSPHMNLFGYEDKIFGLSAGTYSDEGGKVRLAWDADSDDEWQGPCINKATADAPVYFNGNVIVTGTISGDPAEAMPVFSDSAQNMGITFEHQAMTENASCDYFGAKDTIAWVVVSAGPSEEKMENIGNKLHVHSDGGDQAVELSHDYNDSSNREFYALRTVGIQVLVAPMGSDKFESVTTATDYTEAVAYIDKIGTTSQVFMVRLPGDHVNLPSSLVLPKATSAGEFIIEGKVTRTREVPDDWDLFDEENPEAYTGTFHDEPEDVTVINFTGDIKLLTNTTLRNVKLVSCAPDWLPDDKKATYNASFATNGKNVVFETAEVNVDRRLENFDWVGVSSINAANSDITLKDVTWCTCFKTPGTFTAKNVTLYNSNMEIEGATTIAGNFELYDDSHANFNAALTVNGDLKAATWSNINGMTAATVKGNAYLERSWVEMKSGNFAVTKNLFSFGGGIQLANDYDSLPDDLERDPMYRLMKHDGATNITVSGKTFLTDTQLLATGNITLGAVYSDHGNEVFYGKETANKFTVKNIVEVDNTSIGWDEVADDYAWQEPFWWAYEDNYSTYLGWDPSEHYFVIGDNCDKQDFDPDDDVYEFMASSDGAVRVRRASVEKSYYDTILSATSAPADFVVLNDADYVSSVTFAVKLAKLYKTDAGKTMLVTTSEDSIKFIAGGFWTDESPAAMYALKNVKGGLVIDNRTEAYKIILRVLPGLNSTGDSYDSVRVGYYDTLDEAFAKIKTLNNKNVSYAIDIYTFDGVGTSFDKNFTIPNAAHQILINNCVSEDAKYENGNQAKAELYFKDALTLNTNVYFGNVTLKSKDTGSNAGVTVSLGNYALEFDDCNLVDIKGGFKNITGGSVTGNSYIGFRFSKESYDKLKSSGGLQIYAGNINNVGALAVCNVTLTVTGKINVGDLDATAYNCWDSQEALAFYDANGTYLGNDPWNTKTHWDDSVGTVYDAYITGENPDTHEPIFTAIDYDRSIIEQCSGQNYDNTVTKILVPATATLKSGKFTVTPGITVNKDIIADVGEHFEAHNVGEDGNPADTEMVVEPVTNDFSICPYVAEKDGTWSLLDYLTRLCGDNAEYLGELANFQHEGIPFVIAPRAASDIAKYENAYNSLIPVPAGGMYIKTLVGTQVYICYSDLTYAPYSLYKVVENKDEDGNVLEPEEIKIADTMSWGNVVNTINKTATKQDYVIVLNHDPAKEGVNATGADLAPNSLTTPDVLTMPAAATVNSLVIRSQTTTSTTGELPKWYYTGDKITLTCDTTFENINLVGVVYNKTTGYEEIDQTAGTANAGALTIVTPGEFTIGGKVFLNGRHLILDGSGKKGSFAIESGAVFSSAPDSDSSVLLGEFKNLKSVTLNGAELQLLDYFANAANANKSTPVYTTSGLVATDVTLSGEEEISVKGPVTITTLSTAGGFVGSVNGPITVTNLNVAAASDSDANEVKGGIYSETGAVTLTNVTVNAPDSAFEVDADQITVATKLNVEAGDMGFTYTPGKFTVNAAVTVADGSNIFVNPRVYDVEEDEITSWTIDTIYGGSSDSFEFVKATKATAEQFVPAKYIEGLEKYDSFAYDGYDSDKVFLYKQGNVIYGANAGINVKATVTFSEDGGAVSAPKFFFTYDAAIASMNNKNADYIVEITSNTAPETAPIKLTAPAAAKAKSLKIRGQANAEVYYSAAPSFANNVTLEQIVLKPVKASGKTFVDNPYAITLTGNYTLSLDNVEGLANVSGINATAGTLEFVNVSGEDYTVGGPINVKDLVLDAATNFVSSTKEIKSTGTLTTEFTVIKGGDNVPITLNNISEQGSSIEFGRKYTEKNGVYTDIGSTLTINGEIESDSGLVLVMMIPDGLKATSGEIFGNYRLVPDSSNNKVTLSNNKVWFTGKKLETEDFTLGCNDETIDICKANGAFYLVENPLTLSTEDRTVGDYLDLTQAVNRINELNSPDAEYAVFGNIADTNVTDALAHSKLVLPADNKAKGLCFYGDVMYSGKDAVTAFGSIMFMGDVVPVLASDTSDDPTVTLDSKFTLKPNSKAAAKESALSFNNSDNVCVNTITGTKGISVLSLNNTDLVATASLNTLDSIELECSKVAAASVTNIGTIISEDEDNEFIVLGTGNVDNLDGAMVLYTVITEAKNGAVSTNFTLNGTVSNVDGDEHISVWPGLITAGTKLTIASADYESVKANLVETTWTAYGYPLDSDPADEHTDKVQYIANHLHAGTMPLLIAKKADAAKFEVYKNPTGDLVMFKDVKFQVLRTSLDYVDVEISGNGFDTYARNWAEAVAIVDSVADSDAEYEFILLKDTIYADKANGGTKDVKVAGALVTPKATSAKMITVKSDEGLGEKAEIAFVGAINPTANITFDDVMLQEYVKNAKVTAPFTTKINVTGTNTLGFTSNTVNSFFEDGSEGLTFNTITIAKGTLAIDDTFLGSNAAITVGTLDVNGNVVIGLDEDSKKTYAKQTYGAITGSGDLMLSDCFTKAIPTAATSMLSITGKVDPGVNLKVALFNAKYVPNGKTYKLATVAANEEAYAVMGMEYLDTFLCYSDASKTPNTKTALLNAPFVSMDQITFLYDLDDDPETLGAEGELTSDDDELAKIGGYFYYRASWMDPVVTLSIDTDDNHDTFEQTEEFLTWDAAVLELNKIVNNNYRYQLDLLEDIGAPVLDEITVKPNKFNEENFTVVKSAPLAKLNMPVNVEYLTVVGNDHNFIFTTPAVTVNSNITFVDASFICLKKVTNKEVMDGVDAKNNPVKVTYSVPTYTATPMSFAVSKDRDLIFERYRNNRIVYGEDYAVKVGSTDISSIAGTATSYLRVDNAYDFPVIGKLTTFEEALFIGDVSGHTEYTISGDITAVKALDIQNAFVNAANVTVTELLHLESGVVRAVGVGNMKLTNVVASDENCAIIAKQNAKGVSLLSISGNVFANPDCEIGIGIMYATATADAPIYVVLSEGQTIATITKEKNEDGVDQLSYLTLLTGGSDAEEGHQIGAKAEFNENGECEAPGWFLEYVAKTKAVIFKTATQAVAP